MPITQFRCRDGEFISVKKCISKGGCRMGTRCALLPYLEAVGEEREWRGITPSRAGTGPRKLFLERTTNYAVDPDKRAWAVLGIGTHWRLSLHKYTYNVFSEEPLDEEKKKGIPDVLQQDEYRDGYFILGDYKTWGSFKVAKCKGIVKIAEQILDSKTGQPARFKSGKRKGELKTRQKIVVDPKKIDMYAEELQLNRYRIFFEEYNYPISEMWIQVISRDGGTQIAFSRGIMTNTSMIPVKRLPDEQVKQYYITLSNELTVAMKTGIVRKCNPFESWDGRRCSVAWCENYWACQEMEKKR